ncbi:MAG: hypothetical protein AAF961_08770 [Planctomycetota bacterium]
MRLTRFRSNPIQSPESRNPGEDLVVVNPGAWYDPRGGKTSLVYRSVVSHPESESCFGLAESEGGLHFQWALAYLRLADSICSGVADVAYWPSLRWDCNPVRVTRAPRLCGP